MSDDYKTIQQEFVSNLNGTSITEITLVLSILPASWWLFCEIYLLLYLVSSQFVMNSFSRFFLEYLLLVMPCLISLTWEEYNIVLAGALVFTAVMISLYNRRHITPNLQRSSTRQKKEVEQSSQNVCLTVFRAQLMLTTCIAILAVDFVIFPRRFAKSETYGTSIMDIGVGAFVFAAGLTSTYARYGSVDFNFKKTIRYIVPVIVMGIVRLLTVKGIDYQEHASEYGVHWNFYFTLAAVTLSFRLLSGILGIFIASPVAASLIAGGYQVLLSIYQFDEFIIHAPRVDFFSQNREGILSWLGYLALFIYANCIGRLVFFKKYRVMTQGILCFGASICCWVAVFVCSNWLEIPPSRRMVNLTYIYWILAQSLLLLSLLTVVDAITLYPVVPEIYHGTSKYQLGVFIMANILTGLVNISIQTIFVLPLPSMLILCSYMAIVCLLSYSCAIY